MPIVLLVGMVEMLMGFVSVRQSAFVKKYQDIWLEFDRTCAVLGVDMSQYPQLSSEDFQKTSSKNQNNIQQGYALIRLYRQICQHYTLAKQRHYSPQLVAQLHQRVMLGHRLIYQSKISYFGRFLSFIFYVFPARLRQHYKLFWLAFALFYVPLITMGLACYFNADLIYSVMSPWQVWEMEYMYDPQNIHLGRDSERQSDSDMMMFGLYIYNNISIDFQMYALGIFAGIGTIFSTLYNGIVIGAVAGHLTQLGFGTTFWSFVCGHSSFELTAAVIASAAGLRLAQPLISPFPYRRKDAFLVAGKQSIQMLLGAALMTFLAAFIEAFWSPITWIIPEVKYMVALILWGLVAYYLLMAGRGYPLDGMMETDKNLSMTDNLLPQKQ